MYHGKYDAKYRGKAVPAGSRSTPRNTPKATPEKKRSPVGSIIFYTIYFLCIAAFFVGMHQVTGWVQDWLYAYEAAQPTTKCEEVFQQLFADPDWADLYDMAGLEDTEYEGRDAFVAYMEAKVGDTQLTYMETSAGLSGDKKYIVKLGNEKIAVFTLEGEDGGVTDIPEWNLGTVELYYERTHSVTVQLQEGQTACVNGVALDDTHTIQIISTAAEDYLPEGVHGRRIFTQRLTGLLTEPEITVLDADGSAVAVTLDAETGIYRTDAVTSVDTVSADQETLALKTAETYAKYMIEKASDSQLASYFDYTSDIYKTITKMSLWMQNSSGYSFDNETVYDYCRYSDELFSIRVSLSLNVTRTNGTVKEYPVDSTFFFEKQKSGWKCIAMTNVDVLEQVTEVRITFVNDGTVLSDEFYDAQCRQLTAPVVSAPEGQVFAGWFREDVDANGNTTLSLVFSPDENGLISNPDGNILEPMTLYALFEAAGNEAEGA